MQDTRVKKWLRWAAVSFMTGSTLGATFSLMVCSPTSHHVAIKIVSLIMPGKG